jgi:hypothetical protein
VANQHESLIPPHDGEGSSSSLMIFTIPDVLTDGLATKCGSTGRKVGNHGRGVFSAPPHPTAPRSCAQQQLPLMPRTHTWGRLLKVTSSSSTEAAVSPQVVVTPLSLPISLLSGKAIGVCCDTGTRPHKAPHPHHVSPAMPFKVTPNRGL